ncbi:hypothetical protein C6501_07705 [Candidatus Poribacteria bacterium]|nr:MAG: hypothetical protein C6501_07705 [Candidatus Poribacteria bacterium]
MRTYFSTPMAMLISVLTLMMFFEHTDAGAPAVYTDTEATADYAGAFVSCGIKGRLKNKEFYSGSVYCYARMTTESGTKIDSTSRSIWAKVYKTGRWPFRKLKVRTSPTVSAVIFANNASSSYAYARGTLGSVVERDWDRYSNE